MHTRRHPTLTCDEFGCNEPDDDSWCGYCFGPAGLCQHMPSGLDERVDAMLRHPAGRAL